MKLARWQAGICTMGICMTRSIPGPGTRTWTVVSRGDGIDCTIPSPFRPFQARGIAGCSASSSGSRCTGSLLLLLLDELALDKDIDLVADNKLAIEHHVERQAEVLPVDAALGTVADAVAHHGVIEFPVLHHGKRHRSGVALDGQVAGHAVAILSGRFDPGAFEVNRRILVNFQKIRRP